MGTDKTKPTELLRFGGIRDGMTRERLDTLLDAAGAAPNDTVRVYNGMVIVEAETADALAARSDDS